MAEDDEMWESGSADEMEFGDKFHKMFGILP